MTEGMYNTTCEKCIFNSGDNTIICEMGRYEKFVARGEVKDDGVINRICTACRNQEWQDREEGDKFGRLAKELQGVFSLVIVDPNPNIFERLKTTLSVKQIINPRQIVFVYYDSTPLSEVLKFITDNINDKQIKINVSRAAEKKNARELVDIGVNSCNGLYYTVIESGEILPEDTTFRVFKTTEEKLEKLAYISPFSNNSLTGQTVLRVFHTMCNGNVIKNIEEKIQEALEAEKVKLECVQTWEQIDG